MGISEKIKSIEEEISKTPVNKGTERHLGLLKARLARLKDEQEERERKSQSSGEGYSVAKDGDATVVLLGLPSVGKSTLLNQLTNSNSKVGAYDFTTLDVIPGMLSYKGANIQVLDIPGIIRGASKGKGLGKRILSITRSADLLLVLIDVCKPEIREMLLDELRAVGIRPDEKKPNITIEKRGSGGIHVTDMIGMSRMDEEGIKDILKEYKYHNARVVVREDASYEQLVDVLLSNRSYVPTITAVNKIDLVDHEELEKLRDNVEFGFIPISAEGDINLDLLKLEIFNKLDLIRIYMKPKGQDPDFEEPLIIKKGSTIENISDRIHRELKNEIRFTRVWGKSVKYGGQKVSLTHQPIDEDIVTFYT
jgi:hypothetical protein